MIELGQNSRIDTGTKNLITALSAGSLYEQLLSLETCYGSRDITIAFKALSSSSKHLKKRAINAIILLGTDDELLAALNSVPIYLQIQTIRRVRDLRPSRKRPQVIERYLEKLETNDPSIFKSVFMFGSRTLVERHLPSFIDRFTLIDWSRLAKYHQDITQTKIREWTARVEPEDHLLTRVGNSLLARWLSKPETVDYAFELYKTKSVKQKIPQTTKKTLLGYLFARRPKQTVEIILKSEERIPDILSALGYNLSKLPLPEFVALIGRYPEVAPSWNNHRMTAQQLFAVYKKSPKAWRDEDGGIDSKLLSKLPAEVRIPEARRNLKLRKFDAEPNDRLFYIALLPWDEAIELQKPFMQSSDASIRGNALRCQIEAAKYEEAHLGDALQLVLARKNEQDPVKTPMIGGLGLIPSSKWKEHHLADLAQIVQDTVKKSASTHTITGLKSLLGGILSFHPQWAATQLVLVLQEFNSPYFPILKSTYGPIPGKEIMASVAKELSSTLEKALRKKDGQFLEFLEQSLKTYVRYWPEYLDVCEASLKISEMETSSIKLMQILKKYRPSSLARIVPLLIKSDGLVLKSATIIQYIAWARQDLLQDYLTPKEDPKKYRRDALKKLKNRFWCWTPTQQDLLAQILLKDINDDDISTEDKVGYVTQLEHLCFVDTVHLIALANDEREAIQEEALRALGQLDGDQGINTLIDALSDNRARIAIYALRSALKRKPKTEIFQLLKSAPQNKVTVAKETIRLTGELETEEAFQYLLEKDKETLHRDVRIALLRALWSYLDREETWEIFARAAEDAESHTAKAIGHIPDDGMDDKTRKCLLQLLLQLLNHSSSEIHIIALRRCTSIPLTDPDNILSTRLFELVHSDLEDESKTAAKAIFKTYAKKQPALIGEMYRRLLTNRKVLKVVHDTYLEQFFFGPARQDLKLRPVTRLILEILKTDRPTISMRVNLIFRCLSWDEIFPELVEIVPVLHADALVEAEDFLTSSSSWQDKWLSPDDDLVPAEQGLRQSNDERARRLGLALLVCDSEREEREKWTEVQREKLELYKQDESVLVAEAAWNVELPVEDEDENKDQKGKFLSHDGKVWKIVSGW
jgi:hypothetical protein